jgi:hypothetical protein
MRFETEPCGQKIALAAFKIIRECPQIVRADNEITRAPAKPFRARSKMFRALENSCRAWCWTPRATLKTTGGRRPRPRARRQMASRCSQMRRADAQTVRARVWMPRASPKAVRADVFLPVQKFGQCLDLECAGMSRFGMMRHVASSESGDTSPHSKFGHSVKLSVS